MYPEPNQKLTFATKNKAFFFSGPYDPLSNFSAHTVKIWGKTFYTVEHAFQWKKFEPTDPALANKILEADSPWLALKLSRTSRNRDDKWDDVKDQIMYEIVRAKATQHEDVKENLQSTGNKQIIENSPVDDYWGCGADGKGRNQMGKILMKIRDEINVADKK